MIPWLMTACIYPCVVGPDFWGLVHKEWRMCTSGQMQSPVNIDPHQLLYDPHLGRIQIDNAGVDCSFENSGQLPLITVDDKRQSINITGGPALPYKYRLDQIVVHFGKADGGEKGSEHTVDRVRFPAEIQMLAYNSDLYANFSQAMARPKGLLAIAVIVDVSYISNSCVSVNIRQKTLLSQVNPLALLPRTAHYVTYEGSLTYPGCHETVTWVIMNNPIYITREDLQIWNNLRKSEQPLKGPLETDESPMTPSYRPLKAINGRLLRTNINAKYRHTSSPTCASNVYTKMGYRSNPHRDKNHSISKRDRTFEIDEIIPDINIETL